MASEKDKRDAENDKRDAQNLMWLSIWISSSVLLLMLIGAGIWSRKMMRSNIEMIQLTVAAQVTEIESQGKEIAYLRVICNA